MIPGEFHRELYSFLGAELTDRSSPPTPSELAALCGGYARRWYGVDEGAQGVRLRQVRMLISWSERLGKHLGEFYYNPKEG